MVSGAYLDLDEPVIDPHGGRVRSYGGCGPPLAVAGCRLGLGLLPGHAVQHDDVPAIAVVPAKRKTVRFRIWLDILNPVFSPENYVTWDEKGWHFSIGLWLKDIRVGIDYFINLFSQMKTRVEEHKVAFLKKLGFSYD